MSEEAKKEENIKYLNSRWKKLRELLKPHLSEFEIEALPIHLLVRAIALTPEQLLVLELTSAKHDVTPEVTKTITVLTLALHDFGLDMKTCMEIAVKVFTDE